MKVVMIYSGKGGVGKTTTAAILAKELAELGYVVGILDSDVATPSIHKVFKEEVTSVGEGVVHTKSFGYVTESVHIPNSEIKKFIKKSIKELNKVKPDYILIDTPPSITDAHNIMLNALYINGLINVTQPTELSKSDVFRTMDYFHDFEIPTLGLIQNMISKDIGAVFDSKSELNLETLDVINLDNKIQNVLELKDSYLSNTVKVLEELQNDRSDVLRESISKRMEVLSDDEILEIIAEIDQEYESYGTVPYEWRTYKDPRIWDAVKYKIGESSLELKGKEHYFEYDAKMINSFLKHFDGEPTALVKVRSEMNTEIKLSIFEIGEGRLFYNPRYFNLPMIEYTTKEGVVQLYLNEVEIATLEDIDEYMKDGGIKTVDNRYLMSLVQLLYIGAIFGFDLKKTFKDYCAVANIETSKDVYNLMLTAIVLEEKISNDAEREAEEEFSAMLNKMETFSNPEEAKTVMQVIYNSSKEKLSINSDNPLCTYIVKMYEEEF